jgi:hypothetical protein
MVANEMVKDIGRADDSAVVPFDHFRSVAKMIKSVVCEEEQINAAEVVNPSGAERVLLQKGIDDHMDPVSGHNFVSSNPEKLKTD